MAASLILGFRHISTSGLSESGFLLSEVRFGALRVTLITLSV